MTTIDPRAYALRLDDLTERMERMEMHVHKSSDGGLAETSRPVPSSQERFNHAHWPGPDQPAAVDDEGWYSVERAYRDTDPGSDGFQDFRAAVAEAVKLGLVPRVDPHDAEQLRVVAEAIGSIEYQETVWDAEQANLILTALRNHLGGENNG